MIIEYNTNATSVPSRALSLWRSFKKVKIGVSIDGFGRILEYQRYPAKWDKVLANIYKIDREPSNVHPWFAYTVTAYNVLHLPDFIRWKLKDSGLEKFNSTRGQPIVTHHVAHRPLYLNIRILPIELKNLVKDKFDEMHAWLHHEQYPSHVIDQSNKIRSSICDYMFSADLHSSHWMQFLAFTKKLDKIRDENISTIIPELIPWL
jgi:sulfatase maturation enzyme AslB (radical SAM superfamily)